MHLFCVYDYAVVIEKKLTCLVFSKQLIRKQLPKSNRAIHLTKLRKAALAWHKIRHRSSSAQYSL
jgi:hypothetical protein